MMNLLSFHPNQLGKRIGEKKCGEMSRFIKLVYGTFRNILTALHRHRFPQERVEVWSESGPR